jgi:hypothetical protein
MASLNLSAITVPAKHTQTPGKDAYNQEMFFGILLDLASAAKASGFSVNDQDFVTLNGKLDTLNGKLDTLNGKLDTLKTAIEGVSVTVGGTDLTNLLTRFDELKAALLSFSSSVLLAAGSPEY